MTKMSVKGFILTPSRSTTARPRSTFTEKQVNLAPAIHLKSTTMTLMAMTTTPVTPATTVMTTMVTAMATTATTPTTTTQSQISLKK